MQSIFQGLATEQGLHTGRARQMANQDQSERIVFHSQFNGTFDGWRQHQGGSIPYPPPSLTSYPVKEGTHALRVPILANRDGSAYKNLARFRTDRFATFSCFLTHGTHGPSSALAYYGIGIDTQAFDNTSRSFYRLLCLRNDTTGERSWVIRDSSSANVAIPGSGAVTAGDNENKYNWDYVSLTIDFTANGGLGGYHSTQINNTVFDLTGLGAGSASTDPQQGAAYDSFAGGWNCGVFGNGGSSGEAFLVLDEAVGSLS